MIIRNYNFTQGILKLSEATESGQATCLFI